MLSVALYAQKNVTKFLGIPVDGSKAEMIQKLKNKGFVYNDRLDCLEGEFNGEKVYISVVTDKNKVYRIVVANKNTHDEAQIKIRYNTLCRQFANNPRYTSNPQLNFSTSFLRVHILSLLNLQIIRTEIPTSAHNIPLPHNAT